MDFNSRYKIKQSSENIETHEVFLDKLAKAREEEVGLSEKKLEVKISEKLIYSIFALFFIFSAILFSKTFYLQVFEGDQMLVLSQNNRGGVSLIRPERGIIYDRNLKKLVLNSPAYDFICDKAIAERSPEKIKIISDILGKENSEIERQIKDSNRSMVLVSENLNQEDLLILETKINDLPDCQIEKNITRNYTMGPIFSHVLGYNGRINAEELSIYSIPDKNDKRYSLNDYIGKSGLEKFYEKDLRGKPGRTETIKTASGVKKGNRVLSLPEEGHSLVLNIDGNLQKIVYESLGNSIKNVGAKKGAAIAINPRNGAILALVSYPSYDSNIFSGGISQEEFDKLQNNSSQPFFNRAISAQYPVGSTIKPFLGLAALQEKIISANKLINDTGYISIRNQYNPEIVYTFSGVKQHGPVDMIKAIAVSSNIYFFTIGGGYNGQEGLGPSKIKKHLDLFGWENKTGIDLPGEFSGFIPAPDWKKMIKNEPWWDGDTYNLSIGQSDLQVTPLHVALAYSAIANGGTLYRPQIVQKIIKGSPGDSTSSENNLTQIIKEFKPEVVGNYFSEPQNLETIRKGMRDGVQKEYGSSHILNDLPVAVAGKTGTVETNKVGFYNTWSSSFAPYDNPEIVFVVTIESVNGFRSASLPVAHDVLQYYFSEK